MPPDVTSLLHIGYTQTQHQHRTPSTAQHLHLSSFHPNPPSLSPQPSFPLILPSHPSGTGTHPHQSLAEPMQQDLKTQGTQGGQAEQANIPQESLPMSRVPANEQSPSHIHTQNPGPRQPHYLTSLTCILTPEGLISLRVQVCSQISSLRM